MATIKEFLDLLYGQVDRGIYVWGGDGENLSDMDHPESWIERKESDPKDADRAIELFRQRVEDGMVDIRAFDCSGLVYWALKTLGLQKTDLSSRGLYAACEKIEKAELRMGDLVFHHDGKQIVHVGICVGDEQIECRGRDVGVVQNRRKPGYWNRFGRWKAFRDEPIIIPETVKVIGSSVRVREGDHVGTKCIGIAHRGDKFPLLGNGASGWYMIDYHGTTAYITNKEKYTILV